MSVQVNLRLSDELLASVEEARGDVPRSVFIRNALEDYIFEMGDGEPVSMADAIEAQKAKNVQTAALIRAKQVLAEPQRAAVKRGPAPSTVLCKKCGEGLVVNGQCTACLDRP